MTKCCRLSPLAKSHVRFGKNLKLDGHKHFVDVLNLIVELECKTLPPLLIDVLSIKGRLRNSAQLVDALLAILLQDIFLHDEITGIHVKISLGERGLAFLGRRFL